MKENWEKPAWKRFLWLCQHRLVQGILLLGVFRFYSWLSLLEDKEPRQFRTLLLELS